MKDEKPETILNWHLRLYEMGLEANNNLIGIRMMFPMLAPQDPEEARWQQQLRVDRGVYTHLDWLLRMELRALSNLAAIRVTHEQSECVWTGRRSYRAVKI